MRRHLATLIVHLRGWGPTPHFTDEDTWRSHPANEQRPGTESKTVCSVTQHRASERGLSASNRCWDYVLKTEMGEGRGEGRGRSKERRCGVTLVIQFAGFVPRAEGPRGLTSPCVPPSLPAPCQPQRCD